MIFQDCVNRFFLKRCVLCFLIFSLISNKLRNANFLLKMDHLLSNWKIAEKTLDLKYLIDGILSKLNASSNN